MNEAGKPFRERNDLSSAFVGIRQVMDTCVFAANAGAVNHLAGRTVWTLGSLLDAGANAGQWQGGPSIGGIAHEPVKTELEYRFNDPNGAGFQRLASPQVKQWVESEGKLVVLSCPLEFNGQQHGWHMITLVEWDSLEAHFVAWDTNGKMGPVYESEIDTGIPYQSVPGSPMVARLVPHPDHHAFIWGLRKNNA